MPVVIALPLALLFCFLFPLGFILPYTRNLHITRAIEPSVVGRTPGFCRQVLIEDSPPLTYRLRLPVDTGGARAVAWLRCAVAGSGRRYR